MKNLTGILQGTATERGVDMAKTVAIGYQDFEKIRKKIYFMWIRQRLSGNGGKMRMK